MSSLSDLQIAPAPVCAPLGAQRLREIADAAPALPGLHAISGIMTAVQIVDPHTRRVLAYVAMSRHSVRPPRQVVNALGEGPERNFTTADDSRLASIGQSILSMWEERPIAEETFRQSWPG